MAAGSLCGSTVTPLLIGPAADNEKTSIQATPLTMLATAAALNCSVNSSDVVCVTGFNGSTLYITTLSTTRVTTTGLDELVNQV